MFEHTCERDSDISVDLSVVISSRVKEIRFDFAMGCDVAYSVFRQSMMKQSEMDFEQTYINAFWYDFVIPRNSEARYRIDSQYFHVWPNKDSIVVAQPGFVSFNQYTYLGALISTDSHLARFISCRCDY